MGEHAQLRVALHRSLRVHHIQSEAHSCGATCVANSSSAALFFTSSTLDVTTASCPRCLIASSHLISASAARSQLHPAAAAPSGTSATHACVHVCTALSCHSGAAANEGSSIVIMTCMHAWRHDKQRAQERGANCRRRGSVAGRTGHETQPAGAGRGPHGRHACVHVLHACSLGADLGTRAKKSLKSFLIA